MVAPARQTLTCGDMVRYAQYENIMAMLQTAATLVWRVCPFESLKSWFAFVCPRGAWRHGFTRPPQFCVSESKRSLGVSCRTPLTHSCAECNRSNLLLSGLVLFLTLYFILTTCRYERNKHIFPASRWETYDPSKKWDKYTIHGGTCGRPNRRAHTSACALNILTHRHSCLCNRHYTEAFLSV
jgi:hypothetical protein